MAGRGPVVRGEWSEVIASSWLLAVGSWLLTLMASAANSFSQFSAL